MKEGCFAWANRNPASQAEARRLSLKTPLKLLQESAVGPAAAGRIPGREFRKPAEDGTAQATTATVVHPRRILIAASRRTPILKKMTQDLDRPQMRVPRKTRQR
jgi:hypothetical protein